MMSEDPPRRLTPGGLALSTVQSLVAILLAVGILMILGAILLGPPA